MLSVIIIRVDYQEGAIHHPLDGENRLACPPGLCASRGHLISVGKIRKLLVRVFYRHQFLNPPSDNVFKIFLNISSNDKDYLVKSGLQCIMDGIVHDYLSLWPHRSQLLDTFSKPASYAGRHDHQRCFHLPLLINDFVWM